MFGKQKSFIRTCKDFQDHLRHFFNAKFFFLPFSDFPGLPTLHVVCSRKPFLPYTKHCLSFCTHPSICYRILFSSQYLPFPAVSYPADMFLPWLSPLDQNLCYDGSFAAVTPCFQGLHQCGIWQEHKHAVPLGFFHQAMVSFMWKLIRKSETTEVPLRLADRMKVCGICLEKDKRFQLIWNSCPKSLNHRALNSLPRLELRAGSAGILNHGYLTWGVIRISKDASVLTSSWMILF